MDEPPKRGRGEDGMNDIEQLRARVEELEDRIAIRDMYTLYCWLCDNKDWERVGTDIFSADAEESHGDGMETKHGGPVIAASFAAMGVGMAETAHYISNVTIDLKGDGTANAQAYIEGYHWTEETAAAGPARPADFIGVGIYMDELRKEPAGWRITRRRRRNLGPGPVGLGAVPPGLAKQLQGWGGDRSH